MTYDLLTALIGFSFVSSITPGPNNMMLMASGANFGLRRTLPHMAGVGLGFMLMVFLVGTGLSQVFDLWPLSYSILKIASVIYLLYLAWKIASAAPKSPNEPQTEGTPITFFQAAAFQWVNPKAWAMALTATTAYSGSHSLQGVLLVALVFGAVNIPAISCWTILGQQIRKFLTNPKRLRAFNWTMGALLVATLWPILAAMNV